MRISPLICACTFRFTTLPGIAQAMPAKNDVEQFQVSTDLAGIISDTQGVDFRSFLAELSRITDSSWRSLLPDEVKGPPYRSGEVVLRIKILPNGRLMDGGIVLESRSEVTGLDRAWGAITSSIYSPLPTKFEGPFLELRIRFRYNERRQPESQDQAQPMRNRPPTPTACTLSYNANS
jgi:hypothetical protein